MYRYFESQIYIKRVAGDFVGYSCIGLMVYHKIMHIN